MTKQTYPRNDLEIAVIGMSVRVPGANSLKEFWHNLSEGRESTSFFDEHEMQLAGVNGEQVSNSNYVAAKGVISEAMGFEPALFGFSNREAEMMDPQLRVYFECVYNAMVNAGYSTGGVDGLVGIYGGAGSNPMWTSQFLANENNSLAANYEAINLNGQEFFNTRIANTFNFKGPAITVQTACSSSLVAIHQAVQALIAGDCDMALAGGVEMTTNPFQAHPDKSGYLYQEGMIYSKDGKCRPFDAAAGGTVPADGAGIVVLKRLDDAIDDGDHIYAVIKGSAVNNDGSDKIGFTAPCINGQKRVISSALEMAEIEPDTVSYIEAHGTGTKLGDPIEFRALNESYNVVGRGECGLGSLKSNFGHLGAAAGVASFIKTVLSIYNNKLVPSLNYETPNPELGIEATPFFIVTQASSWPLSHLPLRAGVSSFGIGGTNAHLLLEEYISEQSVKSNLESGSMIVVSADSKASLVGNLKELSLYAQSSSESQLSDIGFTLSRGRQHFPYRASFYCESLAELEEQLSTYLDSSPNIIPAKTLKTVFMFPGQGSQFIDMGRSLYKQNTSFAQRVDELFSLLPVTTAQELHYAWANQDEIQLTQYTQPLLFILSYSLSQELMKAGIKPWAMIGHSIGELVAATVAGVFTPESALQLICHRGRLMASTQSGLMLAVMCSEHQIAELKPKSLDIAAVNSKNAVVVSGSFEEVEKFEETCAEMGWPAKRLKTSHAFHSQLMEPILKSFEEVVIEASPQKAKLPFISNLTGQWITEEQAQDPKYWAEQLRNTVKFTQGINTLGEKESICFIEVGPGDVLSKMLQQHKQGIREFKVITTIGNEANTGYRTFYGSLRKFFEFGGILDWQYFQHEGAKRIPLPNYVFDRQTFVPDLNVNNIKLLASSINEHDVKYFVPHWEKEARQTVELSQKNEIFLDAQNWLVFSDGSEQTLALVEELKQRGQQVVTVNEGVGFRCIETNLYEVLPGRADDYNLLLKELIQLQQEPDRILHFWAAQPSSVTGLDESKTLDRTFYSLCFLAQALGQLAVRKEIRLICLTSECVDITGLDITCPYKATVAGAIRVIQQEYPQILTQHIDFAQDQKMKQHIMTELQKTNFAQSIAYRGRARWLRNFKLIENEAESSFNFDELVSENSHWLITGGLGALALEIAEKVVSRGATKLTLVGRKSFIPQEHWAKELEKGDLDDHLLSKLIKLTKLQALGAKIQIVEADVSNNDDMEGVVDKVTEHLGPIDALLHCAGVAGGGAVQHKSKEQLNTVLKAKVSGTKVLSDVLQRQPLKFVGLMSSITSYLGGFGQMEYCAANSFLDACPTSRLFANTEQVVTINWDPWSQVGMAMDAVIPKFQGHSGHTLVGECRVREEERITFESQLSAKQTWALAEHKVNGSATLPGSAYIEMARAGFMALKNQKIRFEDIYFLTPLTLLSSQWSHVYTEFLLQNNKWKFEISSRTNGLGVKHIHASGFIVPHEHSHEVTELNIDSLKERCDKSIVSDFESLQSNHKSLSKIQTGPHWNVFKELNLGIDEGVALLSLDQEFESELDELTLHPSLLDCATAFMSSITNDEVYIPIYYQSLKQFKPFSAECFSYVQLKSKSKDLSTLRFDVTISDRSGSVILKIEGFEMKRVVDLSGEIETPNVEDNEVEIKGLSNEEGQMSFIKAVELGASNVIVSKMQFEQEVERYRYSENLVEELSDASLQPRPDLPNAYVAPKSSVEKKVAEVWRAILSLEQVGINDDFFELGGDSLVLMQIHSQLNELFPDQELPIAELYNHTTIKNLARMLSTDNQPDRLSKGVVDQRAEKMRNARRARRQNNN